MTKKVIGDNASTQADAVAAIKAAAEQRQQSTPQQDAVSLIKQAAAQRSNQQAQPQGTPFDFSKCHLHLVCLAMVAMSVSQQ